MQFNKIKQKPYRKSYVIIICILNYHYLSGTVSHQSPHVLRSIYDFWNEMTAAVSSAKHSNTTKHGACQKKTNNNIVAVIKSYFQVEISLK